MTDIQDLRLELKTVCELRNDILSDSYHPVLNPKHPMHLEANVAFRKLEKYSEELADRIQKNSKAA